MMGNRRRDMVSITPVSKGVMFGEEQKCTLTFCPPCRTSLKDCELVLRVSNLFPFKNTALQVLNTNLLFSKDKF